MSLRAVRCILAHLFTITEAATMYQIYYECLYSSLFDDVFIILKDKIMEIVNL